jgi:nitroimidazol reductase NimA-like FMN-containing flavoprotein (pyridoxamine 5'-phosphate oxidase superfamily)
MRRTDKEITNRREIDTILSKATICRIGLVGNNVAYIVPLNFGYKNNCLYFHSAPIGKKIELITKNNIVCFEVDIDHEIIDSGILCEWSSKYASVIGYGKASFITDPSLKKDALNIISTIILQGHHTTFLRKTFMRSPSLKLKLHK